MNPRNLQIGGWLLTFIILAAAVMISRTDGISKSQGDGLTEAMPPRKRLEGQASPPREERVLLTLKSQLNRKDVLRMTPLQWTARFETMHPEVTAEIRDEIVLIAWELDRDLQSGMDPVGDDAGAYADSILTLLKHGAHETAR